MMCFDKIAPTFAVADVGATARWYAEHLDFHASTFPAQEPFAWASLRRDGVEIMLLRVEGYRKVDLAPRRPEGMWDAYVRVRGAQALYERLLERDLIHAPLIRRGYGLWEFEVCDPNGYVLVFSEPVERQA